jgi:hypothetical protein
LSLLDNCLRLRAGDDDGNLARLGHSCEAPTDGQPVEVRQGEVEHDEGRFENADLEQSFDATRAELTLDFTSIGFETACKGAQVSLVVFDHEQSLWCFSLEGSRNGHVALHEEADQVVLTDAAMATRRMEGCEAPFVYPFFDRARVDLQQSRNLVGSKEAIIH